MLVDIIFPGWVPFAYLAIAKDTAGFIEAHDTALKNYDFDTIVAGHLTRIGTRADVGSIKKEFVLDLESVSCQSKSERFVYGYIAKVGFDDPWLLFSEYINTITSSVKRRCYQNGKLDLVEHNHFMSTHCVAMTQSGRVDPTVQALFQSIS